MNQSRNLQIGIVNVDRLVTEIPQGLLETGWLREKQPSRNQNDTAVARRPTTHISGHVPNRSGKLFELISCFAERADYEFILLSAEPAISHFTDITDQILEFARERDRQTQVVRNALRSLLTAAPI